VSRRPAGDTGACFRYLAGHVQPFDDLREYNKLATTAVKTDLKFLRKVVDCVGAQFVSLVADRTVDANDLRYTEHAGAGTFFQIR
jgi:hypothetical protein